MRQTFSFILIIISFGTSFAQSESEKTRPIFDFDEVTHISINISQEEYNKKRNIDPSAMFPWTNVLKKHVKTQGDFNNFWRLLEHIDYSEQTVDSSFYTFLRDTIFTEKFCPFVKMTKGDSFYKDILVFKKNGEIQGIGKLCMSCNKASFAPPTVFTDCFGEYGEFDRLRAKNLFQ